MITLGQYLLLRLKELGIQHIFGVPGDYNLLFLDKIIEEADLQWVGNCNELNAAYAADGYARIQGAGAVVTTFGVGELSAINGIAGSFAEYVPVVLIVGTPSSHCQDAKALMHHTFADGHFDIFVKMFKEVTIAQALLTRENPTQHIDHVLRECWIKKRPVYIALPSDLAALPVEKPSQKLDLSYPKSNPDTVKELSTHIAQLLNQAKTPIILVDICATRHGMHELIVKLLEKTKINFVNMNMAKGFLNESHSQYIGMYDGKYSSQQVQQRVEQADCILTFGLMMSDFNTGGFTSKINPNVTIDIQSHYVKVHQALYEEVYFDAIIPAVLEKANAHLPETLHPVSAENINKHLASHISQHGFWQRMEKFIEAHDIVVAEMGTSAFGLLPHQLPDATTLIIQPLWSSIGYTVGATLGAAISAQKQTVILFVGDGSLQCTAQEISTMMRQKINPIIFVINNDGYAIERAIHGPKMPYNDIQMWDYAQFPHVFGDNAWSTRVTSEAELEQALQTLKQHPQKLRLIEVMMDKFDYPDLLVNVAKDAAKFNAS